MNLRRGYGLSVVLLVCGLCIFAGCSRPDRYARATCDAAKRWLNIDDNQKTRCLRDAAFREELKATTDVRFADSLTTGHNRDRSILVPRGYDLSSFTPIIATSELPVDTLGLSPKADAHIGKRYVIKARVSWSDPSEASSTPTLWLYGVSAGLDEPGHARDSAMVNAYALDAYQKEFLSRYCWASMLGYPTSLCEGVVYLEIRRDPRGLFVAPQFVGAHFGEADRIAVLSYLRQPASMTESRRLR